MTLDIARARALPLAPLTVPIERGRLAFFAMATGQFDPIYTDVDAARAAGHPDLPVPPTFFFSLEMEAPDPFDWLAELQVDLRRVLHGEQAFAYRALAYAGETVTLRRWITDAYSKKGGELTFLVKRTDITRGGIVVAEAKATVVVRNLGAAR